MSAARAHPPGGRVGDGLDRLAALRARIAEGLAAAGAARVEPETLQPADLLLDLYGEDVRARAYVVQDPVEGERMLRPDFTVPVARVHMQEGRDPARYAYDGLVWRRQEPGSNRPSEYLQAGIELIGGGDAAADDAEVFALIRDGLGAAGEWAGDGAAGGAAGRTAGGTADGATGGARVETGDLGVVFAAIAALGTTEARRAALRRHVWRPKRFQELLERFAAPPAPPAPTATSSSRAALLAMDEAGRAAALDAAGKFVGARARGEVLARLAALAADAAAPPLAMDDKAMIEAVLAVRGPSAEALERLRGLAPPAMAPALDRMERRLEALAARGVDAGALPFDAAFGRSLEYYDGFVFEFRAADPALPPLGGGGRYDALTAALGGAGAVSSAVGGMIRPEALLAAGERPC